MNFEFAGFEFVGIGKCSDGRPWNLNNEEIISSYNYNHVLLNENCPNIVLLQNAQFTFIYALIKVLSDV